MNVEQDLFIEFEKFILKHSINEPEIYNDTPQQLSVFPTILFLENNSTNFSNSTEKSEFTDDLRYKIEIYTKNKSGVARKIITNELKYLIFEFLIMFNLKRTSCTKGEYLDLEVDRTIIIAECKVNNWNGKIR